MRFKRMGRRGDHRLTIPMLSGGINTDDDPMLIADNELSASVNMDLRNGALRTRKALRVCKEEPFFDGTAVSGLTDIQSVDVISPQPIDINGVLYTVVISSMRGVDAAGSGSVTKERFVRLVPLDADNETLTYTFPIKNIAYLSPLVAVACDAEKYNTPFLVYGGGYVYRLNGTVIESVPQEELYAPLVLINGKSVPYREGERTANGVMYEGFNALTRCYRAQFTSSVSILGYSEAYVMPTPLGAGVGGIVMEIVTPYGITDVTMTLDGDAVSFDIGDGTTRTAKARDNMILVDTPLPVSEISGNVTITAHARTGNDDGGSVTGATIAQWFGGTQNRGGGTRLFLAGFDSGKGSCLMWSDVDDPFYFPQNNYMHIGDPSQRITALAKQEDMLVVFKEREMYYTRYVEGSIDADSVMEGTNVDVTVSSAYFPLTQLSPQIGCDAPHTIALCRNRLVWMNKDGRIYTLRTAAAYSERNVREIGTKIHRHLSEVTSEAQRAVASAADIDGRYFLMIGNKAFVFDYGDSGFVNQSSYSSDKRASRNIAWFAHEYPTLPAGAVNRIVSDGRTRAVVIATERTSSVVFKRSRWYFEESTADTLITENRNEDGEWIATAITNQPIACEFVTKQYVFGDETLIKRIKAVYLNIVTDEAHVRLIVDGEDIGTVRRLRGDGRRMQLVVPGVKRCQTFALSVTSAVPTAVKSIGLQYQNLDVTR